MSVYFAEQSWPQLQTYIESNALIILPFGTVEEHGLHLPVNTDWAVAEGIAKRVAEAVSDIVPALVMPGFWTGYSIKKMTKWPGVIRVRAEILIEVFFDVMSSLVEMGFTRLLCINNHGQNPEAIKLAARRISDQYDVNVVTTNSWSMAGRTMKEIRKSEPGGALHGGEYETSLMLYLSDLVDMDKTTQQDVMRHHSDFYRGDMFGPGRSVLSTWYVQESSTGIYGDPTVATRETGRLLMEGIVGEYVKLIREYVALEPTREAR